MKADRISDLAIAMALSFKGITATAERYDSNGLAFLRVNAGDRATLMRARREIVALLRSTIGSFSHVERNGKRTWTSTSGLHETAFSLV